MLGGDRFLVRAAQDPDRDAARGQPFCQLGIMLRRPGLAGTDRAGRERDDAALLRVGANAFPPLRDLASGTTISGSGQSRGSSAPFGKASAPKQSIMRSSLRSPNRMSLIRPNRSSPKKPVRSGMPAR